MNKAKRGFTLIELLVVVAIIGILAAVLAASFSDARMNARDDARKANLKELQLAIELYKAQNGRYPQAGCGRGSNWTGNTSYGNCADFIAGLVPEYTSELPVETANAGGSRGYIYRTNGPGTSYKLMAHITVESKRITSFDEEFARWPYASCGQSAPQATTYAVYSAGAECW